MEKLSHRVYSLLKTVPKGRVTTYKALGNALRTKGYRAIGQILRRNPYAPTVPCHRVVKKDGSIGGFMGKSQGSTIAKKIALLESEGIVVKMNKIVDFQKKLFSF